MMEKNGYRAIEDREKGISAESFTGKSGLRICLVSNLYEPYIIGGAEINVGKTARALSATCDVFVLTSRPFGGLKSLLPRVRESDGIRVFEFYPLNLYHVYKTKSRRIPSAIKILWHLLDLFNIHSFFAARSVFKRERPDIIHTSNLSGLSFSVFWAARSLGIPVVHTLRDYHCLCPFANLMCPATGYRNCVRKPLVCRFYTFLKRLLTGEIPAIVTGPSQFVIDMHSRAGFFRKARKKVLTNFIESPAAVSRSPENRTLDLLFVGRLSEVKGIRLLMEAFAAVPSGDLRLHIAGEGPERGMVEQSAQNDARIVFHGEKTRVELDELYCIADFLVVPSLWHDNFPTVILESFSYGIPVIGSDRGGIPEMVRDGSNGFLFEPDDPASLTDRLRRVVEDFTSGKKEYVRLRENARASAQTYFKETVMKELREVYRSAGQRSYGRRR